MLFDLRSRGRRTTVRIIYIGLAVLLGVGLVGFGIGGGFGGGGLLSAATSGESNNTANYAAQVAKYRKILNKEPQNAVARELLVKNLLLEAGKEGFVTSSGITPKGKQVFQEASEAWMSYLALKPPKPNITLTKDMLRIYGEEGLNQPSQEVGLLQIVVNSEPTNAAYYAGLAEYAYKAHDARLGDLASTKAIALAPAESKKRIQVSLAEVKKNAAKEAKSPSTGGTGAVTATPEGTVTATTSTPTTKK